MTARIASRRKRMLMAATPWGPAFVLVVWGVALMAAPPAAPPQSSDATAGAGAPATAKSEQAPADKAASDKAASDKDRDAAKLEAARKAAAKRRADAAAAKKASAKFLRVKRDENKQPIAMETSIVRYIPADGRNSGLVVDLIGAVHVGDAKYYETLNKKFDEYDAVLYELVAPEGTRIPKGGREKNEHPVAMFQKGLQSMLELEYQLEKIDYQKSHLVHADMTPEQFSQSMKDRNESFLQMFFRMMGQSLAQQGGGQVSDVELLAALFAKDRAHQLKRVVAAQFENMGGMMLALDGPEGSTLITERNKVAFGVLRKQVDAGRKKIAVFYGAGHLPDMEKRLVSDFGLKEQSVTWIEAWNLRAKEPANKPRGSAKSS